MIFECFKHKKGDARQKKYHSSFQSQKEKWVQENFFGNIPIKYSIADTGVNLDF